MKKHLDIIILILGMSLLLSAVLGCMGSNSDCGNAKVVRGKDTIHIDQDSITEAYYHAKSDSMVKAVRAKSEGGMRDE